MTPFYQGLAKIPDVRFPKLLEKSCIFFFQLQFLCLEKVFFYITFSPNCVSNLKTANSAKGEALPPFEKTLEG